MLVLAAGGYAAYKLFLEPKEVEPAEMPAPTRSGIQRAAQALTGILRGMAGTVSQEDLQILQRIASKVETQEALMGSAVGAEIRALRSVGTVPLLRFQGAYLVPKGLLVRMRQDPATGEWVYRIVKGS